MAFVSNRDTKYSTNSEEAIIYPTFGSNYSLFFPKNLNYSLINNDFLELKTEEIFVRIFHYFLSDLFSEEEIHDIFLRVLKKFKDGRFFELHKLLNFEICSITNGDSASFKDLTFTISSEILQKYKERTNNKINILHIGNSVDIKSFVKANEDKDFKCAFLYNQIDNKFSEYIAKNHSNNNIFLYKIDVENSDFAKSKNEIYFHKFINKEYKFSVIDDLNFLNIISYMFLYSILFKHFKRSFIISSVDPNYTMTTAAYMAKEFGLTSLKQFINTTYGSDILSNILNNNLINKRVQKNEKDKNLSILARDLELENLERILYFIYNFDSISINRINSTINKNESYTLNSNIIKKVSSFIFNYNLIDSLEVYNQISSTVKNENLYIDQYSCAGTLGTNAFSILNETKELIINLELYKYDIFIDFISKVVGFDIKINVPWSQKIQDKNIDSYKGDLESVNKLLSEAFNS